MERVRGACGIKNKRQSPGEVAACFVFGNRGRICAPWGVFTLVASATAAVGVATAAAGEEDDSKDDQPYPVIIKELAQAVVVHGVPPN